jgi:hypothetical protein
MRFPHLAHRSAAAHKLHSTPRQDRMNLISGKGETNSRLPAFSLFLPGTCPNTRDRRNPSLFARMPEFECQQSGRRGANHRGRTPWAPALGTTLSSITRWKGSP